MSEIPAFHDELAISKRFGISEKTVRKLWRTRRLGFVELVRGRRCSTDKQLADYVTSVTVNPKEPPACRMNVKTGFPLFRKALGLNELLYKAPSLPRQSWRLPQCKLPLRFHLSPPPPEEE